MNVLAFILALVAVVLFVVAFFDDRRRWIALGLAFFATAWICQLVLASGGAVKLN